MKLALEGTVVCVYSLDEAAQLLAEAFKAAGKKGFIKSKLQKGLLKAIAEGKIKIFHGQRTADFGMEEESIELTREEILKFAGMISNKQVSKWYEFSSVFNEYGHDVTHHIEACLPVWQKILQEKSEGVHDISALDDIPLEKYADLIFLENVSSHEKDFKTLAKISIYKMLLGMAEVGFGYKPAAKKSCAPTISAKLMTGGYDVDDGTINKWLDDAFLFLKKYERI